MTELSTFIDDLEAWVESGFRISNIANTTFSDFKNFTVDGITIIKLVAAIEKLEEQFGLDIKPFFTIPKEYHHLMANLKEQYYARNDNEGLEKHDFFHNLEKNQEAFGEMTVSLKDIIRLDEFDDNLQIYLWIYFLARTTTAPSDFMQYLQAISIVLLTMVDFEGPLHIIMVLLIVPLHKFLSKEDQKLYFPVRAHPYKTRTPAPKDAEKIYPKIMVRDISWNLGNIDSDIPLQAQLIFSVLSNPQDYLKKDTIFEILKNNSEESIYESSNQFLRLFFPKTHDKDWRCKLDIQNLPVIQKYLESIRSGCIKKVQTGEHGSLENASKKKFLKKTFTLAVANIEKLETAAQLLKQLFPHKEVGDASSSHPAAPHQHDQSQSSMSAADLNFRNAPTSYPCYPFPTTLERASNEFVPNTLEEWFEHHRIFEDDDFPVSSFPNGSQQPTSSEATVYRMLVLSPAPMDTNNAWSANSHDPYRQIGASEAVNYMEQEYL